MELRPTLLAVIVDHDERTHEEIIDGFLRCAQDHDERHATLSLRTLQRWMSGNVRTAPRPAQRRVARLYWGYPMTELLAPAPPEPLIADFAVREAVALPPNPSPVRPALSNEAHDPGPDPFTLERQVTMSTRRAARFTAFAETHNVGSEAIEQLRDDVCVLANDYIREPLIAVIGDLVETQETVFRLLEGKQKPSQTRDLYVLAGVITGLIAKASQDMGRMHEAMTQARTVYVCADNADHLSLKAWARGLQSLIAYWAGRPEESVRYARTGSEIASDLNGSVAVWLPALEARSWALLGAESEATYAVTRADDHRDRHEPDDLDNIGGLLTFSRAKQHYYASGTHVFLDGHAGQAEREAATAINIYENGDSQLRSFSDEAGARTELALARVRLGSLEGVHEALAPVLELPAECRIGGIITSAGRVHEALRSRTYLTSPIARGLREEIEAFCQVPAAALPA